MLITSSMDPGMGMAVPVPSIHTPAPTRMRTFPPTNPYGGDEACHARRVGCGEASRGAMRNGLQHLAGTGDPQVCGSLPKQACGVLDGLVGLRGSPHERLRHEIAEPIVHVPLSGSGVCDRQLLHNVEHLHDAGEHSRAVRATFRLRARHNLGIVSCFATAQVPAAQRDESSPG